MGGRLGRSLSAYLDTSVAVWLAQGSIGRISPRARTFLNEEQEDLLISPMVLLELEYLYEIGRVILPAQDVRLKLEHEAHIRICEHAFADVVEISLREKWTRDPFDRVIVAHAKSNGLSYLVSPDEKIAAHYPKTVW